MIRRPPRSTLSSSSAASDVYKRQIVGSMQQAKPTELGEPPYRDAWLIAKSPGDHHGCSGCALGSGLNHMGLLVPTIECERGMVVVQGDGAHSMVTRHHQGPPPQPSPVGFKDKEGIECHVHCSNWMVIAIGMQWDLPAARYAGLALVCRAFSLYY
eukprot:TRINITY_DN30615_c0_g1_i1.p1 TRINITY_DN30615_c0_g1~~TRINITY_DN30615_c0_g1_i1.p1  ORF type:complete len:156 (+),score=20.58 TRINITY_DN30615_c0_g1_i1:117-584(+)